MKKNILFILLAFSLAFSLTSCSDDDKNDDPSLSYDYLCFTAQEAGSTVGVKEIIYDYVESKMDTIHSGEISQDIEYSFDKKEWKKFNLDNVVTLSSVGDKVYVRGNNPKSFHIPIFDSEGEEVKEDVTSFRMTGKIAASGNIMTIVDRTGQTNTIPQEGDGYFMLLFEGCKALTSAPKLPATQLAEYCYYFMFDGCKSLEEAPELPATKLSEGCYMAMFYGCNKLKKAPKLPATELTENCYNEMFIICESLKEAPELPATELAPNCYYAMFCSCSSLVKAPVLPARKLVRGCYSNMFVNCEKLNYVKALFEMTDEELTDLTDSKIEPYTYHWVNGVAAEGTFVKSKNATWALRGMNGVPDGWKIEVE